MNIIRFLAQIIFAIDTIVAVSLFMVITTYYGLVPELKYFFLALIFSRLPDVDMVPYLLFRKKWGWNSHWIIGHHPVLFIALVSSYLYLFGFPHAQSYTTVLFITITMGHFIHDSAQPQGMYWVWPLRYTKLTLMHGFPHFPCDESSKLNTMERSSYGNSAYDQILHRFEKITLWQIILGGEIIGIFIVWFYKTAR